MKKISKNRQLQKSAKQSKKKVPTQVKMRGSSLINDTSIIRSQYSDDLNYFHVSKKEFIRNLTFNVNGDEQYEKVEINPGLVQTFPWVSQIARNFDKYRFRKLKLIFEPSVATIVPGVIAIAPEFDVNEDMPSKKDELFQYEYLTRACPYRRFEIDLLSSDTETLSWMYTRSAPLTTGDLRLCDPMYLVLYTGGILGQNGFASNFCGELWIDYHLEFKNPQVSMESLPIPSALFTISGAKITLPMGVSAVKTGSLPVEYIVDTNGNYIQFNKEFEGLMIAQVTFAETTAVLTLPMVQDDVGEWLIGSPGSVQSNKQTTIGRFIANFQQTALTGVVNIKNSSLGNKLAIENWPAFAVTDANDAVFSSLTLEFRPTKF